jgi:hypothetical protein
MTPQEMRQVMAGLLEDAKRKQERAKKAKKGGSGENR